VAATRWAAKSIGEEDAVANMPPRGQPNGSLAWNAAICQNVNQLLINRLNETKMAIIYMPHTTTAEEPLLRKSSAAYR